MNLELFIAKRLVSKRHSKGSFSRPIVTVAIGGIAIGLAVMILSVAIVTGFKNEVSEKVIGFGAHLQIVNFDNNSSYETLPITQNQTWLRDITQLDGIRSINKFIVKAGIIKTDEYLHGAVFKGVDTDYDWSFFKQYLVEGDTLSIDDSIKSGNIVVSEFIAKALKVKLGDDLGAYFIQNPPRMRKFTVCGIYNTQLADLDKLFVIVDIKHLRKLNNWEDDQITGFEIQVDDFSNLIDYEIKVNRLVGYDFSPDGNVLKVRSIKDEYPGIFDWLSLLDINVWIILFLMLAVAGFNMVSGLLVIILERVNMIGVMKSMGARNIQIEKVFIYFAGFLISRGLLFGNIIGIGLCLIQMFTGLITLDPESYYVSQVPINLNIWHIIILNVGTMLSTIIIMVFPSKIISKISPVDSMRFN
ncbi:MAG: ABC transporter permease [Bacteroidales bacterium]|nr:ABC transporter permease [Bacteroidales bacterium]MDD4217377.1 ABC transporter permease [Bacteroidales bacterium]MDY0141108.1 ABC transporter permease [Bacteroidales bacterium]